MKIIIHDLNENEFEKIYNLTGIDKNENITLISDNKKIKIIFSFLSIPVKL